MADSDVVIQRAPPEDGTKPRKTACTTQFRGRDVTVLQVPREKTEDGQDNTGWSVWECSNICLRYIAYDDNVSYMLRGVERAATFTSLRIVDLSAGAGLLTIAFAAAEAAVVAATDIPAQLPQLWDNVALAGYSPRLVDAATGESLPASAAEAVLGSTISAAPSAESSCAVAIVPLFWGESLGPLDAALRRAASASRIGKADARECPVWPAPASDIVVASDILFIALRDGRAPELRRTLVRLLRQRVCSAVLFGYEERLFREEDAWMKRLGLGVTWNNDNDSGRAAETVAAPDASAADGGAGSGAASSASASASASVAANDALDDDAFMLSVEELTGAATALEWEDSLAKAGAGGLGATEGADLFVPYLFWEPPPVRLFILRLPPGAAPQRTPPAAA